MLVARSISLIALTVMTSGGLKAQSRVLPLPPASARHSAELTSVTSVRELRDGRLLVTDGRDQRLLLLDFSTDEVREIGRTGRGPNEFQLVAPLRPLGADSTLMGDFLARRWLLFAGDRIVVTIPPDNPALVATRAIVFGADSLGYVTTRRDPPLQDGITVRTGRDSFVVVRVHRDSGTADTVATLRAMARQLSQQTNTAGVVSSSSSFATSPIPTEESFAHFVDGALAIARLDPFRVDWMFPDGRWVRGDSLPVPRIRMTARERRERERRSAGRIEGPRPAGVPPPPPAGAYPDFLPLFLPALDAVQPGPDGTVLIRRARSADHPTPSYFVVNRSARLVGEIRLPARHVIVGVGAQTVYLSVADDDDILRIQRHPWP